MQSNVPAAMAMKTKTIAIDWQYLLGSTLRASKKSFASNDEVLNRPATVTEN